MNTTTVGAVPNAARFGEAKRMIHSEEQITRLIELIDQFLNEVLPQSGHLVFRDLDAVTELCLLVGLLRHQQEKHQTDILKS